MNQPKRHHFVPKAYLKSFCDQKGRILVYRKDAPHKPLHVVPDATQFRRYYYSQPTPIGGQDNTTLEALFSTVENDWPQTVELLHQRENVNDRLEHIFNFMALQRVRVPASRDISEAALAQTIKDSLKVMVATGAISPPPTEIQDIQNQIEVSVDPHQSIHAMATMIKEVGTLLDMIGLAAVHNATARPFLTSDNPILWFDPTLHFVDQQPYNVNPNGGPVMFFFPVSPKLALFGCNTYKETFACHGLLHSDVPDMKWVDLLNAQVCRFAYEAVIAQSPGHEEMIAQYAGISPVHEATTIPMRAGVATIHQQVFGARKAKPKWSDKEY
jgi:hypothetical protein